MKAIALLGLLVPSIAFASATNDAGRASTSTFTGIAPAATAATITGDLTFTGSEPTMSPRFFRPGVTGDPCTEFGAGTFQYQTVPFTSDSTGQLTASFDPGASCDVNVYVTFHTAPFNPANICSGFQFSAGSSIAFTETFNVPANTPLVAVVSGVPNAPGVVCGPVNYSIDGVAGAVAPPIPYSYVPVPSLGWSGAILLALGLIGVYARRRMVRR